MNRYSFNNGKKERIFTKVDDKELPPTDATTELWDNLYKSNTSIDMDNEELKELLKRYEDVEIHRNERITREEILNSIKSVPNWKAPGPDMIQGYYLKYLEIMKEDIIDVINEWYILETIDEEYCKTNTTLIWKGGDKDNPANYRPISCANIIYKIYTNILQRKIKKQLKDNKIKINNSQYGCKEGVLASKEALMINNLMQMKLKKEGSGYCEIYYDLVKAYDSINHKWMMEVLRNYKISTKICNIIEDIVSKWKIKLKYSTDVICEIKLQNGILQGDTMSPLLFILALDPLMNKLDEEIIGVKINENEKLNKLIYMDDLKVYINENEDIEYIDKRIIQLYSNIGMKINEKKSGYAVHGNIISPQSIKDKYPEVTEDNKYKYLGLQIYEVNKDKFNEEFIVGKISKNLEEIKKLDLNNKTTIKCINTQIMSLIRYFIGSIIFSIGCLNKIDTLIRKALMKWII